MRGNRNPVDATLRIVRDRIDSMTTVEFRESLVKTGIIDKQGLLTEPYKKGKTNEHH